MRWGIGESYFFGPGRVATLSSEDIKPGNDEIWIFVGHADDAREEADAVWALEPTLNESLVQAARLTGHKARQVRILNWRHFASSRAGGQYDKIRPYIS